MTTHPEAFDLLYSMCLLPDGTSYEMLSNCWAKNLRDIRGALDFLEGMSLVEQTGSTYSVLPVIRRYVPRPPWFFYAVRTSMIEAACAFLKQHDSVIGDPLYKAQSAVLSAEERNLEAILLLARVPSVRVIRDGLLSLAYYQCYHRPRLIVIEHALTLVRATDNKLLHGSVLLCYGNIAFRLDQYSLSLNQLEKALHFFLFAKDRRMVAECRLSLENTLRYHLDSDFQSRKKIISQAQFDYESNNDEIGVARCQFALGRLLSQYRHLSEAIELLEWAGGVFAQFKDQHRYAECTAILAKTYCRLSDHDLAYYYATTALNEYEIVHDLRGYCGTMIDLGRILSARGDYEGSLETLLHSFKVRKSMALPPSGGALEGVGLAWANLGNIDNARNAFQEALQQYSSQESAYYSETDIVRCQFFLKRLRDRELQPTPTEYLALWRWYPQDYLLGILCIL
ncbi:hypothetical protein J132_07429 [Termitomyces sp. J132]|nr:hypothetical protein J132_07429 [Termitomyces sp. J132]